MCTFSKDRHPFAMVLAALVSWLARVVTLALVSSDISICQKYIDQNVNHLI